MAVFLVLHDHHFKPFFLLPAREVRAGQVQGEKRVEMKHTILRKVNGWLLFSVSTYVCCCEYFWRRLLAFNQNVDKLEAKGDRHFQRDQHQREGSQIHGRFNVRYI